MLVWIRAVVVLLTRTSNFQDGLRWMRTTLEDFVKAANFAPVYCALYPEIAEIARRHGYAAAVHGTLARDFDIVCVPWVPVPSQPADVVRELAETFTLFQVKGDPTEKEHGRMVYTLIVEFNAFLDLSFMPITNKD